MITERYIFLKILEFFSSIWHFFCYMVIGYPIYGFLVGISHLVLVLIVEYAVFFLISVFWAHSFILTAFSPLPIKAHHHFLTKIV